MPEFNEQMMIDAIQQRLTSRYPQFSQDVIGTAVQLAHTRFVDSRVRDFIPLLVERQVRAALADVNSVIG